MNRHRQYAQRFLAATCLLLIIRPYSNFTYGDEYEGKVRPLLEQYCYDCHGYGGEEGGMALDEHQATADVLLQRDKWLAVWRNLRAQTMPPSTEAIPTEEERQAINKWIEQSVFRLDPKRPDPGRVTVRRLNRREYKNTIRDLFDYDFDTEKHFPPDDTGYGFDTVGDTLTVSSYLLEEYLKAAESIVESLVVSPEPKTPKEKIEAWRFKGEDADPYEMKFANESEVRYTHPVKSAGEYAFNVRLFVRGSAEATDNTAELAMYVNGEERVRKPLGWDQSLINVPAKFRLPNSNAEISLKLIPKQPPGEGESPLYMSLQDVVVEGPLDGSQNKVQDAYYRIFFDGLPDADRSNRTKYASKILNHFGRRAFRQPLSKSYLKRLMKLADVNRRENGKIKDGAFEEGVARALTAVLASPRFIFRSELQPKPNEPGRVVKLNEFELASRISYFLWSSLPDDELFQLAQQKQLRANLREQVDRMLEDWRSERFFEDFVGQWLQTNNVWDVDISERRILRADGLSRDDYDFNWQVRHAMIRETTEFVSHIFKDDRPLSELLDADYTFLNRRLADFYKLDVKEKVAKDDFAKVKIPGGVPRGGLLTHGSILLVTSNPTRTSPVKRGLFVLENLLGTPAPPAPPDVPELEETKSEHAKTMREQMQRHREDPLCASCHARMDPIGLALENFNAMGLWRDQQGGQPIDTSGRLMTGEKFESVAELKTILATSRKRDFVRCVAEKLLTYALGRGLEYYDMPTIDGITDRMIDDDGTIRTGKDLIHEIVASVPFQKRRGDGHPLSTVD